MLPPVRMVIVSWAILGIAVGGSVPAVGARSPQSPAVRAPALETIPRHVHKLADAIDGKEPSEAWYFHLVVPDSTRHLEPSSARIELFSGNTRHKTVELGAEALAALRGTALRGRNRVNECFDLRHHFREPASLTIDRVHYELELRDSTGGLERRSLDVPLVAYAQKTKLVFPLRGNFLVSNGTVLEGGHHERSQLFALDIMGLGEHYEMVSSDSTANDAFAGWDREIIAPAAGTIVYSRNDVPDNAAPGTMDLPMILGLPEPDWSIAGNVVVIDHGNGEFSCLGHMRKGSVRVTRGQRVRQGQALGRLGNSGHSQGPHLHYHLMDGRLLYLSDGLPCRFENLEGGAPMQGYATTAK